MGFFCDIMIAVLGLAYMFTQSGRIPFEELSAAIMPYTKFMFMGMIAFLLLKYGVYVFRFIQDVRYDIATDGKSSPQKYILLGTYLICDILRIMIVLGILSAMLNQLVPNYETVNIVVDYFVVFLLAILSLVISYFCYDAETIRFNAISTSILVVLVVVYSKGMFLEGVKLFF